MKTEQEADVSRSKAVIGSREGLWDEFGPRIKVITSPQLRLRLLSRDVSKAALSSPSFPLVLSTC